MYRKSVFTPKIPRSPRISLTAYLPSLTLVTLPFISHTTLSSRLRIQYFVANKCRNTEISLMSKNIIPSFIPFFPSINVAFP